MYQIWQHIHILQEREKGTESVSCIRTCELWVAHELWVVALCPVYRDALRIGNHGQTIGTYGQSIGTYGQTTGAYAQTIDAHGQTIGIYGQCSDEGPVPKR